MFKHVSVLLNESIEALDIKENGIYVDMTCGGAGHSSKILEKLTTGHLYSFDQDDYALTRSDERLKKISHNYTLIKSNFRNLKNKLNEYGVYKVDGILYDLGVSSFQLDMKERGFSYNEDAPLDMRMDQSQNLTAADIVNKYSYNDLVRILFSYGDEPNAKKIANAICKAREEKTINTTFELVEIIKKALPQKVLKQKGHPAKLTFQALRIEVNDELKALQESLKQAIELLNVNGRIAVITFQPEEDKIVKHIFKEVSTNNLPLDLPLANIPEPDFVIINKKPILPSEEELADNHRSHSAKLRILRKIK